MPSAIITRRSCMGLEWYLYARDNGRKKCADIYSRAISRARVRACRKLQRFCRRVCRIRDTLASVGLFTSYRRRRCRKRVNDRANCHGERLSNAATSAAQPSRRLFKFFVFSRASGGRDRGLMNHSFRINSSRDARPRSVEPTYRSVRWRNDSVSRFLRGIYLRY